MKTTIFICCFILFQADGYSQISVDFYTGFIPSDRNTSAPVLVNRSNTIEEFQFNVVHTLPQFIGGVKFNVKLSDPFFAEGGLTYSRRSITFMLDYTIPRESEGLVYMEQADNIVSLPVNIGVSIGSLDFTSGFSLRSILNSVQELTHIDGFSADKSGLCLGFQMGSRYVFNRIMTGIEFQSAFQRFCHGFNVNGESLELRNVPSQFVFSIQYRL